MDGSGLSCAREAHTAVPKKIATPSEARQPLTTFSLLTLPSTFHHEPPTSPHLFTRPRLLLSAPQSPRYPGTPLPPPRCSRARRTPEAVSYDDGNQNTVQQVGKNADQSDPQRTRKGTLVFQNANDQREEDLTRRSSAINNPRVSTLCRCVSPSVRLKSRLTAPRAKTLGFRLQDIGRGERAISGNLRDRHSAELRCGCRTHLFGLGDNSNLGRIGLWPWGYAPDYSAQVNSWR